MTKTFKAKHLDILSMYKVYIYIYNAAFTKLCLLYTIRHFCPLNHEKVIKLQEAGILRYTLYLLFSYKKYIRKL